MNSRNFAGGYSELHPEHASAPSILSKSSIKRELSDPREWADTFNYYAYDALRHSGITAALERDDIMAYLEQYGSDEARDKQASIMKRMTERSFANAGFNQAVDELHFHTINRPLVQQWRRLMFGEEFAPSISHLTVTQEHLALNGLDIIATARSFQRHARRTGISSTAEQLARAHATEIDTAIALIEYQKLRIREQDKNDLVIVPAPPRFRYARDFAKRASFLLVNVEARKARGIRPVPLIAHTGDLETDFNDHYITAIDGAMDLGNYTIRAEHTNGEDTLRIQPEPGLLSIGTLTEQAERGIAALSVQPGFASKEAFSKLVNAKVTAHAIANTYPAENFQGRATLAARRISGRLDVDLGHKKNSTPDLDVE